MGFMEGCADGLKLGIDDVQIVGSVVGINEGLELGNGVGLYEGSMVGWIDGSILGVSDGTQ